MVEFCQSYKTAAILHQYSFWHSLSWIVLYFSPCIFLQVSLTPLYAFNLHTITLSNITSILQMNSLWSFCLPYFHIQKVCFRSFYCSPKSNSKNEAYSKLLKLVLDPTIKHLTHLYLRHTVRRYILGILF